MNERVRAIDRCKYKRRREPLRRPRSLPTDTRPTLLLGLWRRTRSLRCLGFFSLLLAAPFALLALLPLLHDDHDFRTSGSTMVVFPEPFVTRHVSAVHSFLPLRHIVSDVASEWSHIGKSFPRSCLRQSRGRGFCLPHTRPRCSRRQRQRLPLHPTAAAAAVPCFIRYPCKTVLCLNRRFLDEPTNRHCVPLGACFGTPYNCFTGVAV